MKYWKTGRRVEDSVPDYEYVERGIKPPLAYVRLFFQHYSVVAGITKYRNFLRKLSFDLDGG